MTRRHEHGSALVEVTWLAVLLLVPLVYVVLGVFEVQRGAFGSTSAARAAARAFVLAPSAGEAEARARVAAAVALADQGLSGGEVATSCAGPCLTPGSTVTVVVAYQVPLPFLPAVLGEQAPSVRVDATTTLPYGTFRQDRS